MDQTTHPTPESHRASAETALRAAYLANERGETGREQIHLRYAQVHATLAATPVEAELVSEEPLGWTVSGPGLFAHAETLAGLRAKLPPVDRIEAYGEALAAGLVSPTEAQELELDRALASAGAKEVPTWFVVLVLGLVAAGAAWVVSLALGWVL